MLPARLGQRQSKGMERRSNFGKGSKSELMDESSNRSNLQAVYSAMTRSDVQHTLVNSSKEQSEAVSHMLRALFGATSEKELLRQQAVEEDGRGRCQAPLIMPWSSGLLAWDLACAFLLIVWIASVVPWVVAFSDELTAGFRAVDVLVDVFFIADLAKNFFVAYTDGYGQLITSHAKIARTYLRGWFLVDLVSCFPLGWFAVFSSDSAERRADTLTMLRLCKMSKLVRLMRIKRAFKDLSALQDRGYLDSSLSAERGLLIIAQLFLFVHIVGCVQFLVARLANFEDDTWVGRFELAPGRPLRGEPPGTQYVVALYHSALQLGMGEGVAGHPMRVEEFALKVVVYLLGAAVTANLFASLAATLSERDPSEVEFAAMLSTLKQYMRHAKMPRGLRANLLFYFETQFPGQKAFDEKQILSRLTRPLLEEVCLHRSEVALRHAFLFTEVPLDEAVKRELACVLERRVFVRGDDVIRRGAISEAMFFIAQGTVDILVGEANQTRMIRSLSQGSFVGEMGLLSPGGMATATVRVSEDPGFMEAYALHRNDFDTLCSRHPEFRAFIESIKRLREIEQAAEEGRRKREAGDNGDNGAMTGNESSASAREESATSFSRPAEFKRDASLRTLKASRAGRRGSRDSGRRGSCGSPGVGGGGVFEKLARTTSNATATAASQRISQTGRAGCSSCEDSSSPASSGAHSPSCGSPKSYSIQPDISDAPPRFGRKAASMPEFERSTEAQSRQATVEDRLRHSHSHRQESEKELMAQVKSTEQV